jgi:hypothetical protein
MAERQDGRTAGQQDVRTSRRQDESSTNIERKSVDRCRMRWLTITVVDHVANGDVTTNDYSAYELRNNGECGTMAMADTALQHGEVIFYFLLGLDAALGSGSFKSLQGFLCFFLCFYTKERKRKKERVCSSAPRYITPPFGLALPNSSVPSFVS